MEVKEHLDGAQESPEVRPICCFCCQLVDDRQRLAELQGGDGGLLPNQAAADGAVGPIPRGLFESI